MHEDALRLVLLIKAVEETDRDGMLLAPADRAAATREASRAAGSLEHAAPGSVPLPAPAQRLLADRAVRLHERLGARFPVVDAVLALARGPRWVGALLPALGLVIGFALSSLDGTRRINVLAFPLLGLVAWNLAVYAAIALRRIRASARRSPSQSPLTRFVTHAARGRVQRLVAAAAKFDAALAGALSRFARDWYDTARPLFAARATRLFHFSAAAVGIGLIAGLYLRGIALDYRAGWESTLLDAPQVHRVLAIAYGPASWLTGVPVPSVEHVAGIRFTAGGGGENAAPWLHLLAATALLFVVLPRLALALVASFAVWRRARAIPLPPTLVPYFRTTFGDSGGAGRGVVAVIPYAYEPSSAATAVLRGLLPEALGSGLAVDMRTPVRYGEEDAFLRSLADRDASLADTIALLFGLSSTPEEENHGSAIVGVRDFLARSGRHAQLLLLVDERPYAARMAAQGGYASRLDERRTMWREFAAARGLGVCFVDLDPGAPARSDAEMSRRVRAALWQPAHP